MNVYLGFVLDSISSDATEQSEFFFAKVATILLVLFLIGITAVFIHQQFPFFLVHAHFPLKKLSQRERFILQNEVDYYKRLPEKKRSEERRVGKEYRCRCAVYYL